MSLSLDVRTEPIRTRERPAVWLLGCTGGAGVSTLTRFWSGWCADAGDQWPCGAAADFESPYVVLVARDTFTSLRAAHELIAQHRNEGLRCQLLGLVRVAASPVMDKPVRQYGEIVTAAVQGAGGQVWQIGWHKHLPATDPRSLRPWHPFDGLPALTKRRLPSAPPADVLTAGVGIVTATQSALMSLYPHTS